MELCLFPVPKHSTAVIFFFSTKRKKNFFYLIPLHDPLRGRQEGGDLRADHHGGQSAEGMNLFPGVTPANGQDEPPQEKKEAVVRRTSNPASSHGADLDTSSLRTHAPYTRAPQACPHLVSSGLMN
jgi:hypothetical protein